MLICPNRMVHLLLLSDTQEMCEHLSKVAEKSAHNSWKCSRINNSLA